MNKEQDECQFPKCSAPSDLIYLGKGLCDTHWEKLCKLPSEKMRKKLGIKYNSVKIDNKYERVELVDEQSGKFNKGGSK